MSSFPRAGDVRRKIIPTSNPISIPSTSIINSISNLDWSLPPSSPLSPLNSHHTASPPTDLPVDIRPGSPTSLLSVPMPNATSAGGRRIAHVNNKLPSSGLSSPHSPLSPAPSTDLSSPETIQFALPSDFEPEQSQSDNEGPIHRGGDKEEASWRERPEGYASDSPSVPKTRQHKRIVPPLLMLNHKRSSSSGLAQRSSSTSASPSPVATHSRFHSQSNLATFPPRDSFIDLEDTLDDAISPVINSNSMYPTPPKRNVAGGLFRHKQSGSIRSVASASSMLPTFVDPSSNDTNYQALPPPSPGLNVPFGGGVVIIPGSSVSTSTSPAASNTWKMFSRDKDKDRSSKKKDLFRHINSEDTSSNDKSNSSGNIRSTSSSPTHPSAPSSATLPKPSILKHPKKIAKNKSHTHPTSNSSPSSSPPILPLSSQPIPLPVPLPLPPTTNNLDPAARQDLIKKHRKLVKVLGEAPRVVGHMEFIGGTALIPGQGAGLGLHSTYAPPSRNYHPHHHHQHHHHAASVSTSPFNSNSNSLGTFLHNQSRQQKGKERGTNDWPSGRDNGEDYTWTNRKEETQASAWADNGARSPAAQNHHYDGVNPNNELGSTLDRAYNEILSRDNDPGSFSSRAYNTLMTIQPKRRHSTPVASEFVVDEVQRNDDGSKPNNKGKEAEKAEDYRHLEEEPFQANCSLSEPIITSPVSTASLDSSAPTIAASPRGSGNGSFSLAPGKAVGAYLRQEEARLREGQLMNDEKNVQSSNARSPVVSPSSPPPVLPPLTTSPPRLRIDSELFHNSNPFDSNVAAGGGAKSAALRNIDSISFLRIDTNELKEDRSSSNSNSSPKCTDKEREKAAQEHENELRSRPDNKAPLASQAPTKPHILPLSSSPEDKAGIKITLSPLNTTPSSPLSTYPSETATSNSKAKGKSRDRTHRTPVGAATFVPPSAASSGLQEQDKKNKQRHPHILTRSDSPESFMDLGDDDIESPISAVDRDDAFQRREKRELGTSATSEIQPNSATPYSPLSPSPLSAMPLSPMMLKPEFMARTTGDTLLETSSLTPGRDLTIHRAPSTTSLTPSLASILSIQTTSTSPDDFHPYAQKSQVPTYEQEKRKKMDKLAKLHRFLGDSVPVELVLGDSYAFKDGDLPAFALGDVSVNNHKKPLWMRRRRSSSSAALPGYEEIDRKRDDLDSKERFRHVKRGVKMEQMFGTRPPSDLYLVHARVASNTASNSPDRPLASPTSPISPSSQKRTQLKGNVDPSYKGKSKHVGSAMGSGDAYTQLYTLETSGGSLGRSSRPKAGRDFTPLPFLFTPPDPARYDDGPPHPSRRRGSGDSNKPLLAFGQGMPVGGRLRDDTENVDSTMLGEPNSFDADNGSIKSSVYMQYRQSLISLGDIVDKDDKASLAELRQYLPSPQSTSGMGLGYGYGSQYEDRDYDSDDSDDEDYGESSYKTKQNEDALATPTQLTPGSGSPNAPHSTRGEPSHSPSLSRRRSLPSRTSTLSLVSTLSGTSTLSSVSILSVGTTATSFSKGLADIPGYYNAPRTEAEGRADMFKARRRRAAKLTNFFGVKYRDLFGEVLESIEAGMREDVRAGRMGVVELEELMMRVKKLRLRRDQLN